MDFNKCIDLDLDIKNFASKIEKNQNNHVIFYVHYHHENLISIGNGDMSILVSMLVELMHKDEFIRDIIENSFKTYIKETIGK